MKWQGRKPKEHYFAHGHILYSKDDNNLFFQLVAWSNDGKHLIKNQKFEVPSDSFVKDIKECTTLDQVTQHISMKVLHQ